MKRAQKRYTTEKQILDEIDEYLDEAENCLKGAIAADAEAEVAFKECSRLELKIASTGDCKTLEKLNSDLFHAKNYGEECRKRAKRLSARRNSIENATLPRLKQALAEFNTILMPITTDPAVVLH